MWHIGLLLANVNLKKTANHILDFKISPFHYLRKTKEITWKFNQQLRGHLDIDVLVQQAVFCHWASFPRFEQHGALGHRCSPCRPVLAEGGREARLDLALGLGGWSRAQRFFHFGLFFQVEWRLEGLSLVSRCSKEAKGKSGLGRRIWSECRVLNWTKMKAWLWSNK